MSFLNSENNKFQKVQKKIACLPVFILFLTGCVKNEPPDDTSSTYYFKATIDGQYIEWVSDPAINSDYETACPTLSGSMPLTGCSGSELLYQGSEGTSIYRKQEGIIDTSTIQVVFVHSFNHYSGTNLVRSWFTNGTKAFGLTRRQCSDPVIDGIVIIYSDTRGNFWDSSFGDQSSNTFEQISLTENTGPGYNAKNWKVKFSGKLYDENGNSITVSNAEMYGPVFIP